jgi:hypothetical protein
MKSSLFLAAVSIAATLAAGSTARAQSDTGVSMKIDLVAWGESIDGLTLKSAKGKDPVTALAFRYSKPVSYSGPAVLEIYKGTGAAAGPAAEGTPAPAAAPSPAAIKDIAAELAARRKKEPNLVSLAVLPPASKHVTVLLAPAAAGTYQAYVIDDDPSKLPYGRMRIHNLSPLPIAMRCNNKAANILKTKGSVVVSPANKEVIYELAYQKDGEWVTQENNIASVGESEQAQLVVLKSDADFFTSQDGSRSGFLQTVILRRDRSDAAALPEMTASEKAALLERLKREEEEMAKEAIKGNSGPKGTPKK